MQRVGPAYGTITEGALSYVPPPVIPKRKPKPKQKPKPRRPGGGPMAKNLALPGFREFLSRDATHQIRQCGHKRIYHRAGWYNGYSPEEHKLIRKKAIKKAMKDYEKLFGDINEEDPIVAYTTKQALVLLNEPIPVKEKISLMKFLVEYRKAKPVATQKITIEQTQDSWAEALEAHFTITDDKSAD